MSDPYKWRVEKYEGMGFTYVEARLLADSVDSAGVPVYWRKVEAALQAGLSTKKALVLFVSEPKAAPALVIEGSE